MKQRIITAVFFGAAMLGGIFGGRTTFLGLFMIISAGCLWELMGLLIPKAERFFLLRRVAGCVAGMLPVLIFEEKQLFSGFCGLSTSDEISSGQWLNFIEATAAIALIVLFVTSLFLILELFLSGNSPFSNIGHYLTGVFYIGIPVGLLFSIATPDAAYTPLRVFGLLLLIWTNDTVAYFVGSQLGRRKLFERISPNKTWEGTIGGGIGTVLMAWSLSFLIKDFNVTQWIALGVAATVFGTLGDLVESMLKRSVGVKDSGNLLPGHGGLLDRFDAFIFALPFFWLVLRIL